MTEQDSNEVFPRTYEGVEAFVSKFNRIRIKKEGQSIEFKHPFSGRNMSFTELIAILVPEYLRFTDAANLTKKRVESHPDLIPQYEEAHMKRLETAVYLSHMIAYGYAFGLFDEGLDEEVNELKRSNAELTNQVGDLTRKLETCQENYEGLRKLLGNDRQVGDVRK
jgi:hypothetical protein